jgi:hypothetical protein
MAETQERLSTAILIDPRDRLNSAATGVEKQRIRAANQIAFLPPAAGDL